MAQSYFYKDKGRQFRLKSNLDPIREDLFSNIVTRVVPVSKTGKILNFQLKPMI